MEYKVGAEEHKAKKRKSDIYCHILAISCNIYVYAHIFFFYFPMRNNKIREAMAIQSCN